MAVPQRIVSLLPGSTEILCALGAETSIVGVSHLCDEPATMSLLPQVTMPTSPVSPGLVGADHDALLLIRAGLSAYPLDLALLRTLQPDLIITQAPTTLEAGLPSALLETTRRFLGTDVEVLSLQPTFLQDIWDAIHQIGAATGQQPQAAALLEALFARVNTIVADSIMLHQPPRVAVLSRCEPLQLAGYWLPDMIRVAGGIAGLSTAGAPGPKIDWEQLLDYAPEVLVVMPCGYSLEQTRAIVPALQARSGWRDLPAVQQGQTYAVDGRVLMQRPGPRIVAGLEILAGLLHPDLFGELAEAHRHIYDILTP